MVDVRASRSTVDVVAGGTTVAVEAEGMPRARLGRPREALADGRLREDIAFQRV